MKKVWLVQEHIAYEGSFIYGIYASQEIAREALVDVYNNIAKQYGKSHIKIKDADSFTEKGDLYCVEEWEIQEDKDA